MRRAMLWCLLILILAGVALVSAQDELLRNPSLDEGSFGAYTTRRGGTFPIYLPEGWNVWLAQQSGDYYNRSDRTTINPHPGPGPDPVQGNRAVNVSCGYVTCTAALYQQVSVSEGANLSASAYAQVKACNVAKDADNCGSAIESGSQTRIGIDPNGGTDPGDSDIIWSNWAQPHDQWKQMTVSATTTGTSATLFLYSTQANPADLNRTYWDSTSLKVGGEGGSNATPVPTAPPEVPFVVPQAPEPDGSLVHRVQPGDTVDSIAVAYGMSRSDVLALNANISDPRLIRLGQEIVIREVPENATGGVNLEAEVTDEPGSESTAEAGSPAEATPATAETAQPDQASGESVEVADAGSSSNPDTAATQAAATLTPAPVVEVADAMPASSLSTLNATVCVTVFNDTNQNRIQEPNEALLPGGGIALTTLADAQIIQNYETDGASEPHCFEELAAGGYLVAASAPQGYGLTSPDQFRVQAAAGTRLDVAFGAAEGVQVVAPPPADAGGVVDEVMAQDTNARPSPLQDLLSISGLVIFGLAGVVLIAGVGMTLFLRRR
ncbi:MAG: LysM peptidoglycan-binding domain-containing protein [Anaerolineae bacterium]|nr:LysM peptidoglycan-binding domain-containing protein [Anaerolineae bacterium]